MANIPNADRQELAQIITGTQTFGAYPKRVRVNTYKDTTGVLKKMIDKYWGSLIKKSEVGGVGKERYVRTYHNSKDDRNKFLSEIQTIIRMGELEYDIFGNIQDQSGNYYNPDGSTIGKNVILEDEKQSLFSGISNTTIIIGAVLLIGLILFLTRKKK